MDVSRLDDLLQFILAAAGQQDDLRDRELGPIHLIKYAYLADLAYAELNDGVTFTGCDWTFHDFGPWSPVVHERIDRALQVPGVTKRKVQGQKVDFVRYAFDDEAEELRLLRRLDSTLPGVIVGTVRRELREHGSNTTSLLRHAYTTAPMLRAAPEERLQFQPARDIGTGSEQDPAPNMDGQDARAPALSRTALKARRERFVKKRDEIRARLAKIASARPTPVSPAPRYDEVYFEGLQQLDEMAGTPPAAMDAEAIFDKKIWKSPMRRGTDVP